MKNRIKKILSCFLVLFTILSSFGNQLMNINAAAVSITSIEPTGYTHSGQAWDPNRPGYSTWFDRQSIDRIHLSDGKIGFCVEPWLLVSNNTGYVSIEQNNTTYSKIIYHGYLNTSQSLYDYTVTQLMIWETLGYTPPTNVPNYATRKAQIQNLISTHDTKPSFNLGSYEINLGESLILTDANNVVSQFSNWNATGCAVKVNGNQLTITPSMDTPDKITISASKYVERHLGASYIYTHGSSQQIYSGMLGDPVNISINLKVNKYVDVTLHKEDLETGATAQGDASLIGAKYGLFKTDGTLVEEKVIPENLSIKFEKLMATDTYYVQETEAPEGYLLNDEKIIINPLELLNNGSVGADLQYSVTSKEQVETGKFIINKFIADDESGITTPEENAEFIVVAKKYVEKYGDIKTAWTHRSEFTDREYQLLKTDEQGFAESKKLAYGDYVILQTKSNEDSVIYDKTFTFTVSSNEQKTKIFNINNKWYEEYFKVIKVSEDTGKTVTLGSATFKIWDYQKNEYVSQKIGDKNISKFKTDENGYFVTYLPLRAGKYRLEEIEANTNFLLKKESVDFEVKNNNPEEVVKDPIQVISFANKEVKGKITVSKEGEVLTSTTTDAKGNTIFNYEVKKLPGAVFDVKAKEDVLDPSDGSVVYQKGEVVETLTTGVDGNATTKELPLGDYEVQEVTAPTGYVGNSKKQSVSLTYKDQYTELVFDTASFENERQKVEMNFNKIDAELEGAISGATFGLFVKNDITAFDGTVVVKAGALVETVKSDKDGMITFKADLPLNEYEVKEIKAAANYKLNTEVFNLDATYKGQDIEVISFEHTFKNEVVKGRLSFVKKGDVFTHTDTLGTEVGVVNTPVFEELIIPGAFVTIYAAEDIEPSENNVYYEKDEAIETLESELDPVYSQLLPAGEYYYIEEKAPIGFVKDEDKHYFTIAGEEQEEAEVVESTLRNERPTYEIEFTKRLEKNDVTGYENAYQDVVFGLFTRDDTYDWKGNVAIEYDTLIGTSGIDEDGHLTTQYELPVGNFYLKEMSTNSAYVLDENEYDFSIDQTNEEIVKVEVNEGKAINNELKDFKIQVNKVDSSTKKAVVKKDFEFTRYADEACTQVIDKASIDIEQGTALFDDVHYGITYIKETKAPQGYLLSNEVVKVEVDEEGVFINDKHINEENDVYSFIYANEMMPMMSTGDQTNTEGYIALSVLSGFVIVGFALLKNKKKLQ